ncbi:MAG: permease, partial [Acidimicrobiales bacterium]
SPPPTTEPFDLRQAPVRFAKTVGRLGITLVPEYFAVVLLIGAFRGWLLPFGAESLRWGFLAVLIAAIAGVLIVIPTAGEIPILLGLAAVGISPAVLGALLIALPAISLPSMAMVGRTLTWRVVAVTAIGVAVFALAAGGLLAALT